MSAFYGEYKYVMDNKSRIFIPSRFRESLRKEDKNYFMTTIGMDKCLYLFLPSTWKGLLANNMEIFKSENKEEERAFKRYFFGNASDSVLDDQGRILIPQNQKAHALLKKEVIIRGVGNKVEIWNANSWKTYNKNIMEPSSAKFSKILDI